ncbi:[3-methyl-2-oxobutanoate dehydrogenase [lipoamide]] kinase, mitochondrial [Halotydeus destructor]|nr:[3-methyl-2-oxobutanoate dehydrogenase [lipoamide]] kinase, mitochondrial [Halotydeus destructor]
MTSSGWFRRDEVSWTTLLNTDKTGDCDHLIKSAQYLHKELAVRVAHRVNAFRSLHFIVGCNPTVLSVHELYIRTFYLLKDFAHVNDVESERQFAKLVQQLLDDHKDVVTQLAEGFRECRKYITNESLVRSFLDRTLNSRLGMRILAENYLSLREVKPGYVGAINVNMKPRDLIESWCDYVRNLSECKYGKSPEFKLDGHVNTSFPYIETPLDYILP